MELTDKYKITFETWNNVASLYEEKFMNLDIYNQSYDVFCKEITQNNPKVLEIGCGPGNITKYILNKRPDVDVLGIDIAPNMISLAQKNNPKAKFQLLDCREISSIKTKFDGIVCGFCLPYLSKKDSQKLIKDCYNLLSKNGILYISFMEGDYEKSGFQTASNGDKSFFYYYPLAELENECIKNHFKKIDLIHVKYNKNLSKEEIHTVLILKK